MRSDEPDWSIGEDLSAGKTVDETGECMIVYSICYLISYILSRYEWYLLSGVILLVAAMWLYIADYRKTKNLIHLRGLFSLFWVGGQGLSCMKLSHLQTDWSNRTWICLALAFLGFWMVFEGLTRVYGNDRDSYGRRAGLEGNPKPLFTMICGLTVLSAAAFVVEAVTLGYIPFLVRGVPHAYSEFHLTGVHYITVSCVLVPSLAVLFFHSLRGRGNGREVALVVVMTLIALAIPILCVSRFQFIFAMLLAMLTLIATKKQVHPLWVIGFVALLLPVYVLLTVARSHDVTYLNGIFEMKQETMPIFITQPYMYIANNYDNFNCMVEVLPAHSMGMKGLFPLWALTGLKFFFPQLINYPIYVNKKELTTLTLFYDAYYDFGWIGVLLFSCVLGLIAYLLVEKLREMRNPIGYLFYAQIAAYFILSFFTTWFSNTTTWFYLIVTGVMAVYYQLHARRR